MSLLTINLCYYRYSRQKISLDDENEDLSKPVLEKDRNITNENNNIEGLENFNNSTTPPCVSEKSPMEDEKKEWSPSCESTNSSVEDDLANIVPWREKLKKSDEK